MRRLLVVVVVSLTLTSLTVAHAQDQGVVIGSVITAVNGVTVDQQPGQPPRDAAQPAKPGTAIVRGRVMAADLGLPLRKAQVRLMPQTAVRSGQPPEVRTTTTDTNGRFEFKEVRGGRYTVTASKAGGYLTMSYGQQRTNDPARPIDLVDGQVMERLDFVLPRGGVITGRVLDEFGDPVTDAQVAASRMQNVGGGSRRLMPSGRMATTNDIGEFRLFALPPGDYYLSATFRNQNGPFDGDDRTGYAPTYFPGTADLAAAQKISLAMGQSINDLTLGVIPVHTARISGTALDAQGRPMRGVVTALQRNNVMNGFNANPGQVRPDGSFIINGVTPGDYTIQLQPQGARGPESEYASADVTVAGSDITGVQLILTSPSTIAGRVIIGSATGTGDAQTLRASALRIGFQPFPLGGPVFGPFPAPVQVNDDWTFQAKSRAGSMRVTANGIQLPWTVKAIRHRGMDITDTGLDVKPNEDITDLEVELTNRTTTLSGMVTNTRGEAVKDYWTLVFSRDREKWTAYFRYVRVGRSDQDGRFTVTGLPPGEYLAVALESTDPNEASDPDFLERIQNRATSLTLAEGETKSLDLKLISMP